MYYIKLLFNGWLLINIVNNDFVNDEWNNIIHAHVLCKGESYTECAFSTIHLMEKCAGYKLFHHIIRQGTVSKVVINIRSSQTTTP